MKIHQPNQARRVQPMTASVAKQLLLSASTRAKAFLHGQSAQELATAFKEGADKYDDNRKRFNDLLNKAGKGDTAAQQELQEIQVWSIENFLKVQALWGSFFEQSTLGDDDTAFIESVDHHETHIALAAQDGGSPRWQRLRNRSKFMVPFYALTSEEFEYTRKDWYSGEVADRAKAGLDVAFDLGMQLDGKFQQLVAAGIGAFTLTGDKWTRVYVPHSRIVTANLPTTNLLVPASGNSGTSKFRLECLKLVIQYCRSWGENAFGDGPLTPTAVFLPSSDFSGFLDQVEIDDPDNAMNRQVFDFGIVVNYGGYNWTFIADPTLDPADGLAYVRFNKPYGRHWSKPSADEMIIDDSPAMKKQNLESMLETKVFATVAPQQRRVNIAAIRYRTAS